MELGMKMKIWKVNERKQGSKERTKQDKEEAEKRK